MNNQDKSEEPTINIQLVPERKKKKTTTTFYLTNETRKLLDSACKKFNKSREQLLNHLLKQVV